MQSTLPSSSNLLRTSTPGVPVLRSAVATWILSTAVWAQAGDKAGEVQPPLPEAYRMPAVEPLDPDQARSAFALPEDLDIELVAAEPLVHEPVAACFDASGRLWVVEMRGIMPNVDGEGELEPVGNITVLTDTDGDGGMDRRHVFMDELVLPRAVLPYQDGVLVIVPPDLLFCRDTDGDGRADEREVIDTGFEAGFHNPEHAINGLLHGLDNWVQCANHALRYRRKNGVWERERTSGGGQWGLTQDDFGRLLYNTNSDPLRGDGFAPHYAVRNPNHGRASGVNLRLAKEMRVWPSHRTPGVNRGYRKGLLVDGRLSRFTAACGPLVYRGDALPEQYFGNAFVCEPAGNLIKRYRLEDGEDGSWRAHPIPGERDFLTSTDERFRPVNLFNGPDGNLYIADLYRGILQHRVFMTSFLRQQVLDRNLENPLGYGRIWRIVSAEPKTASAETSTTAVATAAPARFDMSTATWPERVAALSHPNGWRRSTAQAWIIVHGRRSAEAHRLLRQLLDEGHAPFGRQHALWTLEGVGGLDEELVLRALDDPELAVQLAAVRVAETLLALPGGRLVHKLRELANRGSVRVRHQVILSLGAARTDAALTALLQLTLKDTSTGEIRSAILSGLNHRELEFLQRLLAEAEFETLESGRNILLRLLTRCIVREGRGAMIEALLAAIASRSAAPIWQLEAMFKGIEAGRPPGPDGQPSYIPLAREPQALARLRTWPTEAREKWVDVLEESLGWPNKPGMKIAAIEPLTELEQQRFDRGRGLFLTACASCHQSSGLGEPGKAPRLRHSPYALGSKERLIRIVLHGLSGPLKIDGTTWNLDMPAYAANDEDLAAILTYVRREWGHGAEPISPTEIAAVRKQTAARLQPWTIAELDALLQGR